MKTIYKLSIAALMSLACFTVSSQEVALRFGVEAGANFSTASIANNPLDKSTRVGFQIGITADYALTDSWYVQSGLSYTTKGVKLEGEDKEINLKYKYTIDQTYFQLPVYIAYKIKVAPGTRIVFNAGPYVAYGVGGRLKPSDGYYQNIDNSTDDEDTFGDDGILNRFDFGLGGGVGVEFGKIVLTGRYEWGLTDIGQYDRDYKNRNAAVTLGYKF